MTNLHEKKAEFVSKADVNIFFCFWHKICLSGE